jgi:hypothetical protein
LGRDCVALSPTSGFKIIIQNFLVTAGWMIFQVELDVRGKLLRVALMYCREVL